MTASLGECLICLHKTPIYRRDIELYMCTCNYPIHRICFEKWRATGTSRLCLICQIEEPEDIIEHVYNDGQGLIVMRHVEPPQRRCLHRCCESAYMGILLVGFLIWHIWVFYIRRQ